MLDELARAENADAAPPSRLGQWRKAIASNCSRPPSFFNCSCSWR